MKHNCKDRLCDTPHDELTGEEKKSRREYEERQFLQWAEQQARELCPHGFRRAPGTWYDCHECKRKEELAFDRAIEADREFQTHQI